MPFGSFSVYLTFLPEVESLTAKSTGILSHFLWVQQEKTISLVSFFNGLLDHCNKFFEWYVRLTHLKHYSRANSEVDYKYKHNFLKCVLFGQNCSLL